MARPRGKSRTVPETRRPPVAGERTWLDLPSRPGRTGTVAGAGAAILGGLLWVLASPPIGLWPLGWIAAAPTLWAIDRAPTARRAGLWGALTAMTFTIGGFPWMVGLLTRFGQLPAPVAWFGLIVLGALHGIVFLLGARLVRALRDRRRDHPRGPFPLALCGALGAFTVEVFGWTPFPFSLGGISQHTVGPVRHLSAALGPAGITALVFAVAGAVLDVLAAGGGRRRWLPVAAVAGFAILLEVGSVRSGGGEVRTIKVGIVQPNRPNDAPDNLRLRLEHLHALQRATADLERQGADLVVWSEAAYPFPLPREMDRDLEETRAARIRRGFTIPVVVGAITTLERQHWNSAIMLLPDGRFGARHDKVHRMIGSEYNPVLEWFPSTRRFMPEGAGAYAGGTRAVLLEAIVDGAPLRIAALVCLEDVMPGYGRELADLRPDLVVNVTNDSWFGNHEPLQHEALARYRPIEIGVPLVRAVNTGPSSIIDVNGDFLVRGNVVDGGQPITFLADVKVGARRTSFYAGIGGPIGWIIAAAALAWWLVPWLLGRVMAVRRG